MKLMLSRQSASRVTSRSRQNGAEIIEFALVVLVFLMLLIGIMEFGRWMFTLNAAAEATRWGARLAEVCGSDEDIASDVAVMVRSGGTVIAKYDDPNMVTVKLVGASGTPGSHAQFTPLIPFLGGSWDIPEFTTILPREAMDRTGNNEYCPKSK